MSVVFLPVVFLLVGLVCMSLPILGWKHTKNSEIGWMAIFFVAGLALVGSGVIGLVSALWKVSLSFQEMFAIVAGLVFLTGVGLNLFAPDKVKKEEGHRGKMLPAEAVLLTGVVSSLVGIGLLLGSM